MNTREIASEYRLSRWAGIMRERQESGLSIKSFCQHAGFHENVYYYWQRKLREATVEQAQMASMGESRPVPRGWTQLAPVASAKPEGEIAIEVGGCRVIVSAETDLEQLANVCRMLKTL